MSPQPDQAPDQAPEAESEGKSEAESETDGLGYEEARAELLEVVRTLEQGGATLEESLALWERGERLAQVCQDWLDGARQRLEAAEDRS
jgi:exodeoxyribonuclease VII small subunit